MPVLLTTPIFTPNVTHAKIMNIGIDVSGGSVTYTIDRGHMDGATFVAHAGQTITKTYSGAGFAAVAALTCSAGEGIYNAIGRISYAKLIGDGVIVGTVE